MKFLSFFTFLLFVSIMPFQIVAKPNILDAQVMLMQLGFDPGKPDGLWGKNTANALVEFFESKGKKFDGKLDENAINLIKAELKEKLNIEKVGFYIGQTAHYAKIKHQNYNEFPFKEIICRAVFEAPWTGFKNLEEIKSYLSKNKCDDLSYKDERFSLWDVPQAGIRIDLNGDGIRDLLVFLYGFQRNSPLKAIAFEFKREEDLTTLKSPIQRVLNANEIFESGEYPIIQNARFISLADFNSDKKLDIVYADGTYDYATFKQYPSKLLLSSPNGYIEKQIGPIRARHGLAAGDINNDGHIDIIFGRNSNANKKNQSSNILINDGLGNFSSNKRRLPSSLRKKNDYQPAFIELLDVDNDGSLDIISGPGCGKISYVFWNDGKGYFSDKASTKIKLPYSKNANSLNGCDRSRYNYIDQVYLINEVSTGKRYLGVISSKRWRGREISLFRIDTRKLLKISKPIDQNEIQHKDNHFAYKMNYFESSSGHSLDILDFQFKKISLVFDPHLEVYRKINLPKNLSSRPLKYIFDFNDIITPSKKEKKISIKSKKEKIPKETIVRNSRKAEISKLKKSKNCEAIKSLNAGSASSVTFFNKRGSSVQVFWVDEKGKNKSYGIIQPQDKRQFKTFTNQKWKILDEKTKSCIGIWEPKFTELGLEVLEID